MLRWLEVQWLRLNIWLDVRREYPGYRVQVTHLGGDRFEVFKWREARGEKAIRAQALAILAEREAELRRRNPWISEEAVNAWRADHPQTQLLEKLGKKPGKD